MECPKCNELNIYKANYCIKCGYHFSKKDQDDYKSTTVVGILERIENIYKKSTLKIITGSIWFKVLSMVLVIILGLFFYLNHGGNVKILDSKYYQVQYNTNLDEYYLLINEEETKINLYIPNKITNLEIKHLNKDAKEISKINYNNTDIVLKTNGDDEDYYTLTSFIDEKEVDSLKVYVYRVGE